MFRLLEMRTWQNKLEGIYILILWTMTKFVVSVFRNRHHLIFSRYISTSWLLCIYIFLFLFPTFGVMEEDWWFLVQQILNSVLLLWEFQISNDSHRRRLQKSLVYQCNFSASGFGLRDKTTHIAPIDHWHLKKNYNQYVLHPCYFLKDFQIYKHKPGGPGPKEVLNERIL